MIIFKCDIIVNRTVFDLTLSEKQLTDITSNGKRKDRSSYMLGIGNLRFNIHLTERELNELLREPLKACTKNAATWKQVKCARKISKKTGIPLTLSDLSSMSACGQYIKRNKDKPAAPQPKPTYCHNRIKSKPPYVKPARKVKPALPNNMPSKKQIMLAEDAAKFRGIELPSSVTKDRMACLNFINAHNKFR